MVYFNDASLHAQFAAFEPFKRSLQVLWAVRKTLAAKGIPLRVCRGVRLRNVTPTQTFNDFLGSIPKELKIPLLLWLDRDGPFWDDERHHAEGEYFECLGELVTDTGAAEAACLRTEGTPTWLFSVDPSKFQSDPLSVRWLGKAGGDANVEIRNGWSTDQAEHCGLELERPLASWDELLEWSERECPNLFLPPAIRTNLPAQFFPYVAERSKILLGALNAIVGTVKEGDDRGLQELRAKWMQGDRARFSASSDSELQEFKTQLTFKHPDGGRPVLCSWHGKIQTPPFRIHFEWPLPTGADRLFVAYIGPKITKR